MSLNFGQNAKSTLEVYNILVQKPIPDQWDVIHKTYLESRLLGLKNEILGANVSEMFNTLVEIQNYLQSNNLSGALLTSITNLSTELGVERARITSEISDRKTADEEEKTQRLSGDAVNAQAVLNETAERKSADADEKKNREAEDIAIRAELGAETTERKSADQEEKKAREDADAVNAQAIANEASMRSQVDNLIFNSLAAKANVNNPEFFGTVKLNAVADEYTPHYLYISNWWRITSDQTRLLFEFNREPNVGATPNWVVAVPFISSGI